MASLGFLSLVKYYETDKSGDEAVVELTRKDYTAMRARIETLEAQVKALSDVGLEREGQEDLLCQ